MFAASYKNQRAFRISSNKETSRLNLIVHQIGRGRYSIRLGDRILCKSGSPLLAAARALLAEGVNEDTILTMTHEGSSMPAMRARLGDAAGLRVAESRFRSYRPQNALSCCSGEPGTARSEQEQRCLPPRPNRPRSSLLPHKERRARLIGFSGKADRMLAGRN